MKREPTATHEHNGLRYTGAELRKLAGKQRKAKRVRPPAAQRAHECVILAVDTAKNSGHATYVRGRYVESGAVSKDDDAGLYKICREAQLTAALSGIPCVLVLEKPPPFVYRGHGASTMVGLGAAREAWERAWRDAGGIKARIVRVEPATWRKPVLGVTRGPDLPANERARARALSGKVAMDADEAAAICIGHWAALAGEVLAVLPAKYRDSAGAAGVTSANHEHDRAVQNTRKAPAP